MADVPRACKTSQSRSGGPAPSSKKSSVAQRPGKWTMVGERPYVGAWSPDTRVNGMYVDLKAVADGEEEAASRSATSSPKRRPPPYVVRLFKKLFSSAYSSVFW